MPPVTIHMVNKIIMSVVRENIDKPLDTITDKVYEMIQSLYPDIIFKNLDIDCNTYNGTYKCEFIFNGERYRLVI